MHRTVVQPPGILRVVPEDTNAITAFTKKFNLRAAYVNDLLAGGRREHKGWQLLRQVRWLMHEQSW